MFTNDQTKHAENQRQNHELTTKGVHQMPKYFRLCSITRLPGLNRKSVQNEAALYHPTTALQVRWASSTVDIRLSLRVQYYPAVRVEFYPGTLAEFHTHG